MRKVLFVLPLLLVSGCSLHIGKHPAIVKKQCWPCVEWGASQSIVPTDSYRKVRIGLGPYNP